jgi:hypothetical protein
MITPMTETADSETIVAENSREDAEVLRKIPNLSTLDDLRDLEAGSQVEVTRLSPTQIDGYTGHLIVPDGGMSEVLEEIKSAWGGGKYQLRAKHLAPNGRLAYARGAVQVTVSGYPVCNGKEYINGVWRHITLPAPPPQMLPVQQGQSGGGAGGLQEMMAGLVQTALQGAMAGGNGVSVGDLPALITAISGMSGGVTPRDSFSDLERSLALISRMQETLPGGEPAGPAAADPMDGGGIMQMMLMKMMSDQNAGPKQAPPPSQYTQYGSVPSQQMWANMQQGPQPGPYPNQQPGPPPQQNSWTQGGQGAHHMGAPGYPPQGAQQPPQPRPEPQPDPSPRIVEAEGEERQSGDYDPLTVDDVMQDLAARDEPDRAQFLQGLCEAMGLDKALLGAMFPGGNPAEAQPQPGAGFQLDNSFGHTSDK